MTLNEMSAKFGVKAGVMKTRNLSEVVSGGSAEDFISEGTIVKIVPESKKGYYNENFSKNAVSVIMERCEIVDGKLTPTGEAVQVPLSAFDRTAAPYKQEADGKVVRDRESETVRATGTVIPDWKRAENAEKFMEVHMGKALQFVAATKVNVRAWDRANNAWSTTELREQNVYTIDWVE